jgi:peptidoglycan/LPS O-acetylase OafA/YrhL
MSTLHYQPSVDGLRAVAVICVVVYHIQMFIYDGAPIAGYLSFSSGFLGVDIFFVLSGFLITTLLVCEWQSAGQISLKNFYMRRALRLLPALVVFLAVMIVYSRVLLPAPQWAETTRVAGFAMLYVTNWAFAAHVAAASDLTSHLWSLAVEEQFYLVWPPMLILLLKRSPIALISGTSALIVLIAIYRTLLASSGVGFTHVYIGSDTRADSILIGCLFAALVSVSSLTKARVFKLSLRSVFIGALLALTVYLAAPATAGLYTIGFSIFAFAVGLVLLRVTDGPSVLTRMLERRTLVWIGRLSYGIYLWHAFAIVVTTHFDIPNGIRAALALPIAIALAAISFFCVERPFLKLKKHFAAVSTPAAAIVNLRSVSPSEVIPAS